MKFFKHENEYINLDAIIAFEKQADGTLSLKFPVMTIEVTKANVEYNAIHSALMGTLITPPRPTPTPRPPCFQVTPPRPHPGHNGSPRPRPGQ